MAFLLTVFGNDIPLILASIQLAVSYSKSVTLFHRRSPDSDPCVNKGGVIRGARSKRTLVKHRN